jgi:hypothetical protein
VKNSSTTYFVKRFKDRGHKGWEVREKRPHILDFRVFKGNNLMKTGGSDLWGVLVNQSNLTLQ